MTSLKIFRRKWNITGGVNNIQETLSASGLINAGSVVKSVQRGVLTFLSGSKEQHITISAVNLGKSVLIVDIGGINDSDYDSRYINTMYAYLASSTDITIKTPDDYAGLFHFRASWQVIEFY